MGLPRPEVEPPVVSIERRSAKGVQVSAVTDNFLIFNANPGNVDWFDDAGWKNIVDHWRIAAWIVRQSGFKGICFDPEPYAAPHAQFQYSAQAGARSTRLPNIARRPANAAAR